MAFNFEKQYPAIYIAKDGYAKYAGNDYGFKPDGSEDFSIAIWFLPENTDAQLLNVGDVITLGIKENKIVFWLKGYEDLYCPIDRFPVMQNDWNFLVVTYYRGGQVCFYLNGVSENVYSVSQADKPTSWNDVYFGHSMVGYFKSVRFYNIVIPETDVQKLMTGEDVSFAPCRYFDFETAAPVEKITGKALELSENAKMYNLANALFCDDGRGFYPLDGDEVNPGNYEGAAYTVQAWISIYEVEQSFAVIFMNGEHSLNSGMILYLSKDGSQYRLCAGKGQHDNEKNIITSQSLMDTRTWYNVAVTYDGTEMAIYINGNLEGKTSDLDPVTEVMSKGILRIGTDDLQGLKSDEGSFHGAFGNIAIWNRALTPSELEKYALEWPAGEEEAIVADYIFDRRVCTNIVNGCELGITNIDLNKICRNPIRSSSDIVFAEKTDCAKGVKTVASFQGKNVESLKLDYVSHLVECKSLLLKEENLKGLDKPTRDKFAEEIEKYQGRLLSGEKSPQFYVYEKEGNAYHYYFVSDQIYDAGTIVFDKRGDFNAWAIKCVVTIFVDIVSIYCFFPSVEKIKVPDALKNYANNQKINNVLCKIRDEGVTAIVKKMAVLFTGGGLFAYLIGYLTKSSGLRIGADVVSLAIALLTKFAAGWGLVALRIAALLWDIAALYLEMPKLTGADIIKLNFGTKLPVIESSCSFCGVTSASELHWNELRGKNSALIPLVICKNKITNKTIDVKATFYVYNNGEYTIKTNDTILGKVDQAVTIRRDKQSEFTVTLSFIMTNLPNVGHSEFEITWTIAGGGDTVTQATKINVYILQDKPFAPWDSVPPWTDALNLAIEFSGSNTAPEKDATEIPASRDFNAADDESSENDSLLNSMLKNIWNHFLYTDISKYTSRYLFDFTKLLSDFKECKKACSDGNASSLTLNESDSTSLLMTLYNLIGEGSTQLFLIQKNDSSELETNEVYAIGYCESKTSYKLKSHEAVGHFTGMTAYYTDATYCTDSNASGYVISKKLHEADNSGYADALFKDAEKCIAIDFPDKITARKLY